MAMKMVIDNGKFLCLFDKSAKRVVARRTIRIKNMASRMVKDSSTMVLVYCLNISMDSR